jgi:hypothetical protein
LLHSRRRFFGRAPRGPGNRVHSSRGPG